MNQIELVRLAMAHIGDGPDGQLNVGTVAARFHYSPSHFHRIFKHVAGMSVADYIREKRLEYSQNLLLETQKNVLEICLMSGFDTPQTFNRLFKTKFGLTPVELRRSGQRRAGLSPEYVLRAYYYRMAKGAYPMLKPYIVDRDTYLLVGQHVTLGGSSPSKEGIGWLWENSETIWNQIQNKVDKCCCGVSLDFQYGPEQGEDARHAYLFAAEVTHVENMSFDHESLVVPASKWLYIPVRFDDPFVKNLASPELRDDMGYLAGCVFGWSGLWCKENGYEPQGWPMGLEIMGLTRGYEEEGGPQETICVPIRCMIMTLIS